MKYYVSENIENSLSYLKLLFLELNFYNNELDNIEKHKPFYFQKNKLKEYEKQKDEIKKHIEICNNKIKNQYELMSKIVDNKDNC